MNCAKIRSSFDGLPSSLLSLTRSITCVVELCLATALFALLPCEVTFAADNPGFVCIPFCLLLGLAGAKSGSIFTDCEFVLRSLVAGHLCLLMKTDGFSRLNVPCEDEAVVPWLCVESALDEYFSAESREEAGLASR